MRLPVTLIAILLIVDIIFDSYIFFAIRNRVNRYKKWLVIHSSVAILFLGAIIAVMALPVRSGTDRQLLSIMWLLYAYLSVYIPKILWVLFDLVSKLPEIFGRKRIAWLSLTGIISGMAIFIAMWWGALINRFNIDINTVDIDIPELPENFNGYRIVQFSDFHVGTYDNDTSYVSEFVNVINNLHPNLIVFTGDIVNRRTKELIPFIKPLSRLKASDGVYSILGNHDYGDYSDWISPEAKDENMKLMKNLQSKMGWHLLLNETVMLRRGNDSIALIGVENIGDPPFRVYGSLNAAYPDASDNITKILLTHNPAHWTDSIAEHENVNIALTLSGHTHAMQITVGPFSPACLRYKTWGGLYNDNAGLHRLYVNIGAGAVGMPMRIGATPEITVLTLNK